MFELYQACIANLYLKMEGIILKLPSDFANEMCILGPFFHKAYLNLFSLFPIMV